MLRGIVPDVSECRGSLSDCIFYSPTREVANLVFEALYRLFQFFDGFLDAQLPFVVEIRDMRSH